MSDDRTELPGTNGEETPQRPRVLVVDDEPAMRRFLKLVLDRLDFEVDTAAGGAEAIQATQRDCYDIVLTDLIMPRVDGLEVIRAVKESSPDMDGLTEFFNHAAFSGFLTREFVRARRNSRPLSLLFLDVDDFKDFNTRKGHLFGDQVLRQVAQVLKAQCRGYDIVARYGGDEFAVLAPETDVDGGRILGERFVRSVSECRENSAVDSIALSIGVASFPAHAAEPEDLIRKADEAMYSAKRAGGGLVAVA